MKSTELRQETFSRSNERILDFHVIRTMKKKKKTDLDSFFIPGGDFKLYKEMLLYKWILQWLHPAFQLECLSWGTIVEPGP